ncbi:hypothetical protein EYC80_002401 [Monilinia laxa]|uniref:Uncharacterized protein n=1 Tax=Monilinia laxa TaxID=61186 RepID=A0A5N6K3S6_MONLA|nr:hypothetical protein EYC80_002401 [Monilinia laxa]
MSKKNKLFKQYGIAPYTGSIEKNKENSMTWRHQPIKKDTTWLNAMKESKAVECLVTLKNSSFGLVRSNRGTSHGYAKMFENENFSQNSNMAS